MNWAVFLDDDRKRHVMPCDAEGEITPPHISSEKCVCDPEFVPAKGGPIIVHNENDE